jgi:hypothetical protein
MNLVMMWHESHSRDSLAPEIPLHLVDERREKYFFADGVVMTVCCWRSKDGGCLKLSSRSTALVRMSCCRRRAFSATSSDLLLARSATVPNMRKVVERLKTHVCQALDEGNNRLHSRRFLY